MALRPYQYVEVDNFLHLRRRLTVSQFSSGDLCDNITTWSLCDGKHRLKQIRGHSALQTSMVLTTLLLSAVHRKI